MKVFDISREVFTAPRYDGDPFPELEQMNEFISSGFNTSVLHLPLHTGTHIDAPRHIFEDGKTINEYDLSVFCGECRVVSFKNEIITGQDIENLRLRGAYRRLLIKGNGKCRLSKSAAFSLIDEKISLVGIDSVTIGTENDDYDVHKILLSSDCLILEGLDLSQIPPQNYELFAAPLKCDGAEAAPCRAFLTHINL